MVQEQLPNPNMVHMSDVVSKSMDLCCVFYGLVSVRAYVVCSSDKLYVFEEYVNFFELFFIIFILNVKTHLPLVLVMFYVLCCGMFFNPAQQKLYKPT